MSKAGIVLRKIQATIQAFRPLTARRKQSNSFYEWLNIDILVNENCDGLEFLSREEEKKKEKTIKSTFTATRDIHQLETQLPDDCIQLLQDARREHEDRLYVEHSNLNAVGISSINIKERTRQNYREPCIVLYCSKKGVWPSGETPFPQSLSFREKVIPVDIRETTVELASTEYQQPLKMGYDIGRSVKELGSLGPFIQGPDFDGFLTCAHAFYESLSNLKADGELPPEQDLKMNDVLVRLPNRKTYTCGTLGFGYFIPEKGIDIAAVKINESCMPMEGEFRNYLMKECELHGLNIPVKFNSGQILEKTELKKTKTAERVFMFGRTASGISIGHLHQNGALMSLKMEHNKEEHVMKEIYQVNVCADMPPFIEKGDSGSAVFAVKDGELYCIGIAIAKSKKKSLGFVTPIDNILEVLGRSFRLKQFTGKNL